MKILIWLLIALKLKIQVLAHFDKKSSKFYNLTKERYFIDKTNFLGEFFLNKEKQLYFITCPHQFGKTIYIDMIKTFAGIELDKNNVMKNQSITQAYEIFSNLSIAKNKKIINKHLTNHPVILVDLSVDHGRSWDCFLSSWQSYIKELFMEYEFIYNLYKENGLVTPNLQFMDKLFNSKLNQNETMYSLKVLIEVLNDFFGARVILLVDHYDALVSYFFHSPEDINRAYEFINGMIFHALEDEVEGLQYGLIFGVSSLMFPIPEKHFHNITILPFLGRHRFVKYFGFTKTEFKSLCKEYSFTPEDTIQMKVLFEYVSLDRIKLYNPFSVTEYLKSTRNQNSTKIETIEHKYCSHKDEFSFISLFMKSSSFRQITIMLLRLHQMGLEIVNVFHESENIFEITSNLKFGKEISTFKVEVLLAYFFEHGFLGHEIATNSYAIPNLETDIDLRNKLKLFYMESKNMFGILQLMHVLKEILHCPSNATVETKQNLNQTMFELFDDVKQSEKYDFSNMDLIGLIYAFASDMNLWACSEGISKKVAFLKHNNKHVMKDQEMMSKLATITALKLN